MEHTLNEERTQAYDKASPVQQFFLTWRATMGALAHTNENTFDVPDSPQKKFDYSFDMFQEGKKHLLEEMGVRTIHYHFHPPPDFVSSPDARLTTALQIEAREQLLDILAECAPNQVPDKEKEIAQYVQQKIALYPRNNTYYQPRSIKRYEILNCIGASTLGSALLTALNIKHLQASVHRHALLLLVTSNQEVYWWDMFNPHCNCQITDQDLTGASVKQLVNMSKTPHANVTVRIQSESFRNRNRHWKNTDPMYVHITDPDHGQHRVLLTSTGYDLKKNGSPDAALEALSIATHDQPMCAYTYYAKGYILETLKQHQEALDAYEEALRIEPENPLFHTTCTQQSVRVYGG